MNKIGKWLPQEALAHVFDTRPLRSLDMYCLHGVMTNQENQILSALKQKFYIEKIQF